MKLRAGLLATLALASACHGDAGTGHAPWPDSWALAASGRPVHADSGMVVTTDSIASVVGLGVLKRGGNAVDAAVAVSFALAVVNPEAGNIGGGGFMVARLADGTAVALDYREKAPLAATRDMFLDSLGEVTDRSLVGPLAAGVPGTVMGMWEAHRRLGSLPWEELVAPAVALARGFVVTDRFVEGLSGSAARELAAFEASASALLPGGRRPRLGDTLRLPDLASTLERIRDQGADGFYRGETADLIVAEMERAGGIIAHRDLASYSAVWREPIRFQYRGYTILSMPPPSSGGVAMAEASHILERYDLGSLPWGSAARIHLSAEAWRRAFADRNHYLADPDFVEQPTDVLTSMAYADFRARDVRPDRATSSSDVGPGVEGFRAEAPPEPTGLPPEGRQTTHFSIVDREGNAVAVTTTLNAGFGSKAMVTGAGFLLNNEMDDFAAAPGTPNLYGLVQGENNAIQPRKRMLSSMSPTVVLGPDGRLFMVTGSPGGPTIITTVWQTISNVVDHGMSLSDAVIAPRIHHQHLPDRIDYEAGGLTPEVVDSLRAMGHEVRAERGTSGDVQAILVAPDGSLVGQSDPRGGGAVAAY